MTASRARTWEPTPPGGFLYGSGGGTTRLFSEPGYQKGVVPNAARPALRRPRPRRPGHLDGRRPELGDARVGETQTFPNGKKKYGEYRIGGTSLSSPLFAGYMALADQKARLPPRLPQSRHLPPGRGPIRSATSGPPARPSRVVRRDYNNGVNKSDGTSITLRTADMDTSLHTKKGYDDVTGLGAPRGAHLLKALRHR